MAGSLLFTLPSPVGADDEWLGQPAPDRQSEPQTSDGVQGAIAPWVPPSRRAESTWKTLATWQVVPGVTYEKFDLTDARGNIRGHLMRVDLDEPGVSFDYAGRDAIASSGRLLKTVLNDGAIAGVNGDFFDINDTDAPLGVGRDRQHKFLHGRESGWNSAFFIGRDGSPQIDILTASTSVKQFPDIKVTNVNSPSVRQGGVGLYTPRWGKLRNYRVTDGQKRKVRMVIIKNGKVTANKTKIPKNLKVQGKILIGRDEGVRKLRKLKRGTKVSIKTRLTPRPKIAITGNVILVRDSKRLAIDDRDMHPRTAVGIDRDTNEVILLVIDGRQSFSRGYTMVELAKLMKKLGAEDALNLDGGGSSTMVAKKQNGKVRVVNSPSDGRPRDVPNGLEVFYAAPAPASEPPVDEGGELPVP